MVTQQGRLKTALNWDYLSWAGDRFGKRFALSHWRPSGGLVSVPAGSVDHHTHHVLVRAGIAADHDVYDTIFRKGEYNIPLGCDPKLIIDAGAFTGMSSVFFSLRYPRARILAIEPDPANFAVLAKHAAIYPNIVPLRAGLWRCETLLRISNPGADSWSFRVEEAAEDGFEAVTVEGLMRRFGVDRVDVLKMDIEGSELEVMQESAGWMRKVKALVVELHDRFKPGCKEALDDAVKYSGLNWTRSVSGESEVLIRA